MTKLFIVPRKNSGEGVYQLVSEHGEGLYGHYCSHGAYAPGDLILHRQERQDECKEKFGEYEVMFLEDQTEINEAELIRRNKKFHSEQEAKASVATDAEQSDTAD